MQGQQLQQAVTSFVEEYSLELNLQQTTIKNKRNSLNRLLLFIKDRAFTIEIVREYIVDLQNKSWTPASIRAEIKILRAFCSFCVKRKYITENFCRDLVVPKIHKKARHFVSEEIAEKIIIAGTEKTKFDNALAQVVKTDMRIALRFILRTGIRISEAIKLRGKDFNLDDDEPFFIVQSKGGDSEALPLPTDMIEELRHKLKQERVFRISEAGCNRALERGCKALQVVNKLTCHSLRHIFSLSRLRRREPLQLVSRALRHSSVKITDDYYSEFVLSDLVPVINNSEIIQEGLTVEQLFDRVQKAVDGTHIAGDKRITLGYERKGNEFVVRIKAA
jgi:integrase